MTAEYPMQFHPIADLFPLLEGPAFDDLVTDVRANGLRDPVVLLDGQVLDGRNRLRACREAGVEPRFVEFDGSDPLKFVVSKNLRRRHLTESQKALIAARMANMRQGERTDLEPSANLPKVSQGQAAALLGVSERLVRDAAKVGRNGTPELVAAVSSGTVKASAAAVLADAPAARQLEVLTAGDRKAIKRVCRLIKEDEKERRAVEKERQRQDAAAEAANAVPVGDDQNVIHADFRVVARTIPDDSIDLILADPPWSREFVPVYGELAEIATRILKPGASLVAYVGHHCLHEVYRLVTPHLRPWWLVADSRGDGPFVRMTEYGVVNGFIPLVWLVKGSRRDKLTFVEDRIETPREKALHPWQQAEADAQHFIDRLTLPGQVVFDPFAGSATTAAVAKKLGRRWLTCDIDEASVLLARRRLAEADLRPAAAGTEEAT
jgi:hypothetical protein